MQKPFVIHRYASPAPASVNSYWIETDNSVIVIDTQRVLSQGKLLRQQIDKVKKPIAGIIITHAHPDHFSATSALLDNGTNIPIYSSPETALHIETDHYGLIKLGQQMLGDDYPKQVVVPNHPISSGKTFDIRGVTFQIKEMGSGEAEAMSRIHILGESIAFVGDVVNPGMHPFLLSAHITTWIEQLNRLATEISPDTTIYPGHGTPSIAGKLIQAQQDYLTTFRELITNQLSDTRKLIDLNKAAIVTEIQNKYPDYDRVAAIPTLLDMNVEAVAADLSN
jgi:glyoxylase-like metal-dependent hydrolase (beta-lactamase superfamily II)